MARKYSAASHLENLGPLGANASGAPDERGDTGLPPEAVALLNTIAGTESAQDYNIVYRGDHFNNYEDHPKVWVKIPGATDPRKMYSSAAGKYQFIEPTWHDAQVALGLPDFSPASQDKAAWYTASQWYNLDTGRDLLADLKAGGAENMRRIATSLSAKWDSLPAGGDPLISNGDFASAYDANLSGAAGHPVPPVGIDEIGSNVPSFADRPLPFSGPLVDDAGNPIPAQGAIPPASVTAARTRELLGLGAKPAQRIVPPASVTARKTDDMLLEMARNRAEQANGGIHAISVNPDGTAVDPADDAINTPELLRRGQGPQRQVPPASVTAAKTDALLDLLAQRVEAVTGSAPLSQQRPAVPSFEERPLPFSGPLAPSAPSLVDVLMPRPRPAPPAVVVPPLPASVRAAPAPVIAAPSLMPSDASFGVRRAPGAPISPVPDFSGQDYGSDDDMAAISPIADNAFARMLTPAGTVDPSGAGPQGWELSNLLAELNPASTYGAPAIASDDTRSEQAASRRAAAPAVDDIGSGNIWPQFANAFLPGAQRVNNGSQAGMVQLADPNYRPAVMDGIDDPQPVGQSTWLPDIIPALQQAPAKSPPVVPAPASYGATDPLSIFFSPAQAKEAPPLKNVSGSPDDRPSIAPTYTTKKVTETVANPSYDQWLLDQTKPQGNQLVTTSTGAPITRSMQDAMNYVGPNAYLKPIIKAPPITPAPPKTITRTRTVTVPDAPNPKAPEQPAAANPVDGFMHWMTTPLWGPKSESGASLGDLLAGLFSGGSNPSAATRMAAGLVPGVGSTQVLSAPPINISQAPADSPAAGLLAKNGGGLGENAMVSFRPGAEQRWLTGY